MPDKPTAEVDLTSEGPADLHQVLLKGKKRQLLLASTADSVGSTISFLIIFGVAGLFSLFIYELASHAGLGPVARFASAAVTAFFVAAVGIWYVLILRGGTGTKKKSKK